MAVVMNMRWSGVTVDLYEAARRTVGWEEDVPAGARQHVASFDEQGLLVTDIWDSAAQFDRFVEERLGPATQRPEIEGQPEVIITEVHRTFSPRPL
jgi:hypothetical protein